MSEMLLAEILLLELILKCQSSSFILLYCSGYLDRKVSDALFCYDKNTNMTRSERMTGRWFVFKGKQVSARNGCSSN